MSVCIVALNEEDYIGAVLQDVIKQTYPHEKIEVLLIDSMSTDKTKDIMMEFKKTRKDFERVEVLTNIKRKQASGWNVALVNYTGDVIVRIDAHAEIPCDFIEKNVAVIVSGEYVSGGKRPNIIKNDSEWGKMLLSAEQSMFGSSFASFRHSDDKAYVKSVFHGMYRREVFEKVGLFNEQLGRTEDNEIHYRVRQAGYKICYSPDIISYQYTRSSLKKMLKQKYGNGYWIALTLKVCPKCLSLYHFVPVLFVCGIILTTVMGMLGCWFPAAIMWGAYWLLAVAMTVASQKKGSVNKYIFLMPFIFFLLHVSYGIGSAIGMVKLPFWEYTNV